MSIKKRKKKEKERRIMKSNFWPYLRHKGVVYLERLRKKKGTLRACTGMMGIKALGHMCQITLASCASPRVKTSGP